jgi:hypothetical protein
VIECRIADAINDARLQSPPAQRSSQRRCDLGCAAMHHRVTRRWRPCVHTTLLRVILSRSPPRCTFTKSAPRRDKRGVDLISDVLPFGRLWYAGANAISYANFYSRSHDALIRVYDEAGNVIDRHARRRIQGVVNDSHFGLIVSNRLPHEHAGEFKEW